MLKLYIPKLEDYNYEEKLENDSLTMNYNAGYDVNYFGYNYNTGTILFPKEKWEETYKTRIKDNKFFAYLLDTTTNDYVGYVNYQYNKNENRYECGILIEYSKRGKGYAKEGLKLLINKAKENGIKELFDNFEANRQGINIFFDLGFNIVEKTKWKKFGKEVAGIIVKKEL